MTSIVLNDWMNAYSSKTSPLAKRFSDEFYRGFHLAKDEERGSTNNLTISSIKKAPLSWERTENDCNSIKTEIVNRALKRAPRD